MAIFRPIDWDGNAGTGWFNTAYSGNMKNAGTAMFYGRSFESAGWLAVFKNTEKTTVTITKVHSIIGNRANQSKVHAKVMCKPLGKNYTSKLTSISIESKYTTSISNAIPRKNKLSSEDTVSVKLNTAIKVNPGEYFCVGFLGTDIPSGSYFNMALRRLTKNVANIFYTQDSNTSKTVTWYRSGNANDNTNWKKHYAYIWAEGTAEQAAKPNPPVTVESSSPKPPRETDIGLTLTASDKVIPQGATAIIKVTTSVKTDKADPTKSVNVPGWRLKTTKIDKFNISCSGDTITVESGKTSKDYSSTVLNATIVVIAESKNNTGRTIEKSITIQATPPTINSLTISKDSLRPSETASISCTYSDNAGGVKYSLSSTTYASLSNSIITAKNRTDSNANTTVTLTATTNNGGVTKSLNIPLNHWSDSDLQVALSTDTIFADSASGADGNTLRITNTSSNSLSVNYKLIENTVLSFSNTKNLDTQTGIAVNTEKLLYTYGTISANTTDTLKAELACDTSISRTFNIALVAPVTADIQYPIALRTQNSVNLPAIAHKNSSGSYEVYFSTYPIQIAIDNSNSNNIQVILKEGQTSLKIGKAFDNTILSGKCWMRPEVNPRIYTANKLPETLTLTYTLIVKQYIGNSIYQEVFNKEFTINYTIYKDDSDLISVTDQNTQMTTEKAERTLAVARTILNQYRPINLATITKHSLINNYKQDLTSALQGLYNLIDDLNNNSYSLIILPLHRTELAIGQYIMADDSVDFLANGLANPIKNNHLDLDKPTASPFKEIVKAAYNLTGPAEHYTINYAERGINYNISKINGTSIDSLYL